MELIKIPSLKTLTINNDTYEIVDETARNGVAGIPAAVNTALAEAKASGAFKGDTGVTGSPGVAGKDGTSATHSWSGTTLTITSASGTSSANLKGDKGDKGDAGSPGSSGKDGTSVSVKSVSESAADGGNNVITFTDGKTVTIKNGSRGSTGATGATGAPGKDGKDYVLTASDKTEIAEQVENATIVQAPTFVDSVNKMTDASKVYVLAETGHIWSYMDTTVEKEVTKTDKIVGVSGNDYVVGSRFSSSTAEDTFNNDVTQCHITPLIDLTKPEYQGKTIQLHLNSKGSGVQYASTGAYTTYVQCRIYGVDKTILAARMYTVDVGIGGSGLVEVVNGTITVAYNSNSSATLTIKMPPTFGSGKVKIGYIRFCGIGAIADSNVYIAYPAIETVTGGQWVDTGTTYAPNLTDADKQAMVEEVAELVDTQLLTMIGDGVVTV